MDTVVALDDLLLWIRCRRQYLHFDPRTAGNDDLWHYNRREAARVRAVGTLPYAGARRIEANAADAVEQTRLALAQRSPLVDAVFEREGLRVVVDLLRPARKENGWYVELFRPAVGVREPYVDEAAAILWATEGAGVEVVDAHLLYLNKEYRRDGALDQAQMFRQSTLTSRARKRIDAVRGELQAFAAARAGSLQLSDDYRCSQRCALCVPHPVAADRNSVLTLHKGAQLGRELVAQGFVDIRTLPDEVKLSKKQRIQQQALRAETVQVDCAKLTAFWAALESPLYFLDFEACAVAVPPYDGLIPFEHCPVLASLHRADGTDGGLENLTHSEFVSAPGRDERASMFEWLRAELGDAGSIVVYGRNFESAMIRQLGRAARAERDAEQLDKRLIDLLDAFSDFAVYHPDQRGKVSLKRVLPALTGSGYEDSEVRDGMQANLSYTRLSDAVWVQQGDAGARAALAAVESAPAADSARAIADYCALDTEGMVRVLRCLYRHLSDCRAGC